MGGLGFSEFIFILVVLVIIGFSIQMIIDCSKNESLSFFDKAGWIIAILITQLPGALLYYFFKKYNEKSKKSDYSAKRQKK